MMTTLFPVIYGVAVIILLWQAFKIMGRGFWADHPNAIPIKRNRLGEDRTGRVTVHPELLDKEGRITDEELLTVRFSEDAEPPLGPESSRD